MTRFSLHWKSNLSNLRLRFSSIYRVFHEQLSRIITAFFFVFFLHFFFFVVRASNKKSLKFTVCDLGSGNETFLRTKAARENACSKDWRVEENFRMLMRFMNAYCALETFKGDKHWKFVAKNMVMCFKLMRFRGPFATDPKFIFIAVKKLANKKSFLNKILWKLIALSPCNYKDSSY